VNPTRAEPDVVGRTVSHYRVLERLGGGGMGVVYKAEDTKLNRPVALKFLPIELTRDPEAKTRFLNEARAASALDHPNICTVHEIDETADGHSFICMSFYEGETLKRRLERGALPVADAVRLAAQIADGLAKAHAQGILHRDVKPANVIVTVDGTAKIIDFGLAKLAGQAHLTRAGVAMGTASYMSPEQAQGRTVDGRTDIWSLGVLLYQMIAGEPPFRGDNEQAIMFAIVHEPHVPLRLVKVDLPEALVAIVERCLEKDCERRFASAAELRVALRQVLHALPSGELSTITTVPPISARRLTAQRRRRLLLAVGALVATAALVAAGVVLRRWLAAPPLPVARHVAFLPLEATGLGADERVLADGLTAAISEKVARLEGVAGAATWVIAPDELRRRSIADADTARRDLGATLAATGRLSRTGETVRLELALRDPASDRTLRQAVIEDRAANLPALQDEPALAVARLLGIEVDGSVRDLLRRGNTGVPAAFDGHLRGLGLLAGEDETGRLELAVSFLDRALQADRLYASAWVTLAEACRRRFVHGGEAPWGERAREAAERAVGLDAALASARAALGDVETAFGRPREALSAYTKAAELAPNAVETYWKLAQAHAALGDDDAAVRAYETAIYRRPDYWACYNQLGVYHYRQGRYEAAVTQFRQVVALLPEGTRGLNNLGALYLFLDRWPEAAGIFERSLAVRPEPAVCSNLGTVYFYQSRFGDAARMYEQALESDASDYMLWGNLGAARRLGGDQAGTREAYRRAIAAAAAEPRTGVDGQQQRADLAGYHALLGEHEQARSLLEQVIAEKPSDANVIEAIGESFDDLGDRQRALEWIGRALAGGYSRAVVEHSPALRELRADPGFARLVGEVQDRR
jgi:serine/threonine-protein kinase